VFIYAPAYCDKRLVHYTVRQVEYNPDGWDLLLVSKPGYGHFTSEAEVLEFIEEYKED
jgi:hypothetical protein